MTEYIIGDNASSDRSARPVAMADRATMTDRRDFGGKPSEWRWGRVLLLSWKIPEFCSVGGARSKNRFFRVFMVPFDYRVHSLQETLLGLPQTNGTDGKPKLWMCAFCYFLLVWRVCGQAFGRHRPLKLLNSGYVTIMKIENLNIVTRRKFTDSKNAILFYLGRKMT